MIIVHGMFKIDPAEGKTAARLLDHAAATSRGDEGNIDFRIAEELGSPGVFRVTEVWRDEAAFLAHTQTPHSGELVKALGQLGLQDVAVTRYAVLASEEVSFPVS